MKKKLLTVVVSTLVVFTFSCTSIKKVHVYGSSGWEGKGTSVFTVYTKSKELYEFSKKKPAVIVGDRIVGEAEDTPGRKTKVYIPLSEAKVMWIKKFHAEDIILAPLAVLGTAFSAVLVVALVASH
jgi:hypothetical protein